MFVCFCVISNVLILYGMEHFVWYSFESNTHVYTNNFNTVWLKTLEMQFRDLGVLESVNKNCCFTKVFILFLNQSLHMKVNYDPTFHASSK